MSETQDETISPEAAGKMLGRNRHFIVALIQSGELVATDERRPGAKIPRYRIHPVDVQRWRASRTVVPESVMLPRPVPVPLTGIVRQTLERMRTRQPRGRVPA